jgi:hypothetical protein
VARSEGGPKEQKFFGHLKIGKFLYFPNPIAPYRFKAIIAKSAAAGCNIKVYTPSPSSSCAYTYGSEISGKACGFYFQTKVYMNFG